jgi:hypothetical protein
MVRWERVVHFQLERAVRHEEWRQSLRIIVVQIGSVRGLRATATFATRRSAKRVSAIRNAPSSFLEAGPHRVVDAVLEALEPGSALQVGKIEPHWETSSRARAP